MIRAAMAILALTLALPGAGAMAQDRSWVCDEQMDRDREELKAIATNISMFRILQEYRDRWDAQYIRQQCEAYSAGESYEIGCLNGRRDWEEIKAMVPADFFGMSTKDLRPHFVELDEADDGYKAAIEYCRSVGAIE